MEPENTPLEKEKHLPNHPFQVQAVNLPGCKHDGFQKAMSSSRFQVLGSVWKTSGVYAMRKHLTS